MESSKTGNPEQPFVLIKPQGDFEAGLYLDRSAFEWLVVYRNNLDWFYSERFIKKASGGKRRILAPCAMLKGIQRLILSCILEKVALHRACHGFTKKKSIVTNAKPHVGKEVVINIDLEDFFPTLTFDRVQGIFRSLGFSPNNCRLLALACCHKGVLPQGSPASPALANIACFRLDCRLAGLARKLDADYTRYADDITLSGGRSAIHCLPLVRSIIKGEGFRISEKKFRIIRQGNRQEVTGLTVNQGVALPRETRRRLRAAVHNLKNGKPMHWEGHVLDIRALMGHLSFLRMIHPELAENYIQTVVERYQFPAMERK